MRWGGDQRGRLDTEGFDEHGDDARCLVQGRVGVVGVHDGRGGCVLMASEEPSVEALPRHLQCELSVVPLCARGDRADGAVILDRMSPWGIVAVHAWDTAGAVFVGSGISGLGSGVG